MILSSLNDNKQYFWIKVPKTATVSFSHLFTRYTSKEPGTDHKKQSHFSYIELQKMYQQQLPAVSVVRNPVSRFKSIIYFLENLRPNTRSDVRLLWESTESCVNFLNTVFERNCTLKGTSFSSIFVDTDMSDYLSVTNFLGAVNSCFRTQAEYAYHPKVKIFYYEELHKFIEWIDTALGYDTSKICKANVSTKSTNVNVDFNDPELIKTIENLYYIDYKVFGYPLRYLK